MAERTLLGAFGQPSVANAARRSAWLPRRPPRRRDRTRWDSSGRSAPLLHLAGDDRARRLLGDKARRASPAPSEPREPAMRTLDDRAAFVLDGSRVLDRRREE
jgi:hypothetical protein